MKTRLRNLIRFLYLSLAIFATAERASGAEPQPYLALRVSAGRATLSLTGVVGAVYLVQYATSLSPWGLYDMIGNVHEWCQDWYGLYPTEHVIDPQGPASGRTKVARGGYWGSFGESCRSAFRYYNTPILRWEYYGFRVVLALRQ
jgi:hypothetical protein